MARSAGTPYGTVRSLRPLPSTRTTRRVPVDVVDVEPAQLADPDAGGVEQLEDRDVAQARRALPSSARAAAASSSARASAASSAAGSVLCAFGVPSAAPGSSSASPVRCAQAVKTRTAVARRAMVERALPRVCCLASQLRRVRRSSERRSVWPIAAACSSIPATSPM